MQISENSRVWIYQSNRALTPQEQSQIQAVLNEFTAQWHAHGDKLAAAAEIRHDRFIILSVDEAQAGASGCSIDRSVNLMKDIEKQFGLNLFDRFNIVYRENGTVKNADRETFEQLVASQQVTGETIVFNNLVATRKELETNWQVPMKDSWHARVFG
ncbi:MAG TPA: ABC transporter ATPase [Sphingobacteriaceae bacterium]